MSISSQPSTAPSLQLIELGLSLMTLAIAFCWPRSGSGFFFKVEAAFGRLARKRAVSVFLVGVTACTLRLLMIPLAPIPQPFVYGDFSFLLAADTFASGRLANPTHPMWKHFETFHITQKPTYASMYFPAQGMLLAAGQVLAGHPWYGVLASCALMCAVICWMLQGWVPPGWALLGGVLAILRLALFSFWINSYFGPALSAIGGALVLGALPRIQRSFSRRNFVWMALGMSILAASRPYEGLLVSVPALAALAWCLLKRAHPPALVLLRRAAPAVVLLLATAGFMAYYNYRVFGDVFTPPYRVDRATYASAPHFLWQSARPEPVYRHKVMRDFYSGWELSWFRETRTPVGLLKTSAIKLLSAFLFNLNFALIAPVFMLPWALRDRRIRFFAASGVVFGLGMAVETWLMQQYVAPFTAALYAILLQCMRHLRVWRPAGLPSGLFLVRAIPTMCVGLAALRLFAQPLHIALAPETQSTLSWYGTAPLGLPRAKVLAQLDKYPGRELAIVRYSPGHEFEDWVFNAADIDNSNVVWAREMDAASNLELLNYFKSRKAWLVEPYCTPPRISPYPVGDFTDATARGAEFARTLRHSSIVKP
ncbi:MAG: hypothetical protein JOY54_04280 [Acidobacteriaceae bacterium]|nr:hypothetical protein [Acidobacteriaceae bacterium]